MSDKAKILCFLISTLMMNVSLMCLAPYFAILADSRGISLLLIGIVYSTSPIFTCLSSILISARLASYDRRSVCCAGILANALGFLGLAFSTILPATCFIPLSLLSRAVAGVGIACVYISNLSTIAIAFQSTESPTFPSWRLLEE